MAKRKESKPGLPLWYDQGKAAQWQLENSKELSIANHLAVYAENNGLSVRMLKRYVALKEFVDENFHQHIGKFTDQTPYSSIEELLKLHKLNPAKAAQIAESVISGQTIAAGVKHLIELETKDSGSRNVDNTRSEARKAAFQLQHAVVDRVNTNPGEFGLSGTWKEIDLSGLSIKPDLGFETAKGKRVAIEIRYFSMNSSTAFFHQALTKYAWLQMNFFDEVYLAVNQDAVDLVAQYADHFQDWTGQTLQVISVSKA